MFMAGIGNAGLAKGRIGRLLLLFLAAVLLVYLGVCAYLWDTQRAHIFKPIGGLQATPASVGMKFEVVHIPSGNGSGRGELYGWWLPAEQVDAPTVLYLHGNDGNISDGYDLGRAGRLHGIGFNVLMIDYRGYGDSTGGKPSEAKVYEDAEAAWHYLLGRRACLPQRTFIYGHSLGGAIAIELAVHHPEAAGLIVESSFTSMMDMARLRYGPYLPVDWLLNQRFDSLGRIARLKVPVLFIHGTSDHNVPYRMSRALYDKAPQPKYLLLVEGGKHENSSRVGWVEYRDALAAFMRKYAHPASAR